MLLWLTAILLFLLLFHIRMFFKRSKYSSFPRVPVSLWWYPGHALMISQNKYLDHSDANEPDFEILTAALVMLRELQADTCIFFFFSRDFIFSINTKVASTVLSSSQFLKPQNPNIVAPNGISIFGRKGIVTEPGTEVWAHKRKTLDPAFQKKFLRMLTDEMNGLGIRVCEHLEAMPNTNRIEIYDVFMKAALEVVCRCGFNLDDKIIEADNSPINTAVNDIFSCIQDAINHMDFYTLPWVSRKGKRLLKKQADYLKGVMRSHLQDRLDSIQAGTDDKDDILSYIIRANMFDSSINMNDVLDDFFSFLSAGMETTAITMSVLMWHILKNPEIYKKLKEEVLEVFGDKDTLSFDDLNNLIYMEQCVKETLRIDPPAEVTTRSNPAGPIDIEGYHFPKGSWLFLSEYGIHHRADIWPEPDKFDPERFNPKKKIAPFTFIPFTAGPRICIGKHFAMMEMKILISRLIKEFHIFDADPGNDKLVKIRHLTAKPKFGVYIGITK